VRKNILDAHALPRAGGGTYALLNLKKLRYSTGAIAIAIANLNEIDSYSHLLMRLIRISICKSKWDWFVFASAKLARFLLAWFLL